MTETQLGPSDLRKAADLATLARHVGEEEIPWARKACLPLRFTATDSLPSCLQRR